MNMWLPCQQKNQVQNRYRKRIQVPISEKCMQAQQSVFHFIKNCYARIVILAKFDKCYRFRVCWGWRIKTSSGFNVIVQYIIVIPEENQTKTKGFTVSRSFAAFTWQQLKWLRFTMGYLKWPIDQRSIILMTGPI